MNIGMLTMATAQSGDLAEVARQVETLGGWRGKSRRWGLTRCGFPNIR